MFQQSIFRSLKEIAISKPFVLCSILTLCQAIVLSRGSRRLAVKGNGPMGHSLPNGSQPPLPNRRRHLPGNFVLDDPGSPVSHVSCHCGLMAEVCYCFSTSVFADAAKARRADHGGIHPLNSFCWFEKVRFVKITCQLIFNDLVLMSRFMWARSPVGIFNPTRAWTV